MHPSAASVSHILYPFEAYNKVAHKGDRELQKLLDSMWQLVKGYLAADCPIEIHVNGSYPAIWEVRLLAISWLLKNPPVLGFIDPAMDKIRAAANVDPRFGTLSENLLFALRVNQKFVGELIRSGGSDGQLPTLQTIPSISLDEMLSLFSVQMPAPATEKMTELLFASLDMEFGSLAAIIAITGQANFPDDKLDGLTGFLAGSAQVYGALTREMRGPKKPSALTETVGDVPADWLAEQFFLAETDLEPLQNI